MSEIVSETHEVPVVYDASDFRSLFRVCSGCRRNAIWIIALPLLPIFFKFIDGVRGIDLFYSALPFLLISLLIVVGLLFVVPPLQIRARRKNGWDKPMAVELNEHGIATRHPSQNTQFHWAAIKNVVANENRLFLFTTSNCAIILPRRVFPDDRQFTNWVDRAFCYWREAKDSEKE